MEKQLFVHKLRVDAQNWHILTIIQSSILVTGTVSIIPSHCHTDVFSGEMMQNLSTPNAKDLTVHHYVNVLWTFVD